MPCIDSLLVSLSTLLKRTSPAGRPACPSKARGTGRGVALRERHRPRLRVADLDHIARGRAPLRVGAEGGLHVGLRERVARLTVRLPTRQISFEPAVIAIGIPRPTASSRRVQIRRKRRVTESLPLRCAGTINPSDFSNGFTFGTARHPSPPVNVGACSSRNRTTGCGKTVSKS